MKTLYLIRHSKSAVQMHNQEDFDRPLNERGKKDAEEMGKRLHKKNVKPDLIISSPALRALKTSKLFATEIGYPEKNIRTDAAIYEANIDKLIGLIREIKDENTKVFIFGHNPAFTGLVGYLTNTFLDNMPTSGVAQINFDLPTWKQVTANSGKLSYFDFPKNQPAS
ncbi:MAG: histidine phosphatase family protein [Bacteroidota bacterium]